MQIIVAILLIALIFMAFQNRKQEKKEFVREERDEESGKYWDQSEQDWTSKRKQENLSERKSNYQLSSAEQFKKEMMRYLYAENPGLADLDSKGYAQLNDLLHKESRHILVELEKIRKKGK